jgi:trk system potassium uptake protein TrkH
MRKGFRRTASILHVLGGVLQILCLVLLVPLIVVAAYWGQKGDGLTTLAAFAIPAVMSLLLGIFLRTRFQWQGLEAAGSMILCALAWLVASALSALPFVIGIGSNYLNAYFEAMSGFTTTGITVYMGLDDMPRSILFWRSLTQWLGGLGILSFFLIVTFRGGGFHHIYGAESHKIASTRPTPGLFGTVKILWVIYAGFTLSAAIVLSLERMPVFDSVCHALTALSTGGFSPHDASIDFYRITGHPNFKLLEYTLTFFMMLGGINFLIHYRVLTGDFRALRDNIEIRFWWFLLAGFTIIIMGEHIYKTVLASGTFKPGDIEQTFRYSIFQVVSILTTTGFGTKDIGADFFGTVARQLFLVMMVIGGCVGSTGGGIKVLRVAILTRLIRRELFKIKVSEKASTKIVIDGRIVPDEEIHKVAALFFTWIALLLIGGAVTALFSNHGPLQSLSGMFSALGNIGPCYISVQEMIDINPFVKITYIFGMLAGRLEILPVLLLFSRRAWQ